MELSYPTSRRDETAGSCLLCNRSALCVILHIMAPCHHMQADFVWFFELIPNVCTGDTVHGVFVQDAYRWLEDAGPSIMKAVPAIKS